MTNHVTDISMAELTRADLKAAAKAKKAASAKTAKPRAKAKKSKQSDGAAAMRSAKGALSHTAETKKAAKAKAPLAASKQTDFIAAMRTAKGISIAEAAERFGWQPHTVRGAVAGVLKKRLGLIIEATKLDERGTVYRIAA